MTKQTIVFSILTILLLGCNLAVDQQKVEKKLKENISGDWERIFDKENSATDRPPPPSFGLPQGMTISNDSIEFYLGYSKIERDSVTGKKTRFYIGNMVPYKIYNDSIIIKNPLTGNWEFKWKFVHRQNDTLKLEINDSIIFKYKMLNYNLDTLPDFDQIIYSSSGCYGSCPIIDISIDKNGNVLFQGEGYVKPLGFYATNIDENARKIIFNKFKRANPLKLLDEYSVGHTDDQSLTTTFIKNNKIVKTIHDYGMAATKELIWAYVPIASVHNRFQLDSLPLNEPFYPKLHYYTFKKDGLILPLEKSESFYLWTELEKSKQTEEKFSTKYKLTFRGNYTYFGPDPNKERQDKYEIKAVTTDGQFYKFEFKGKKPITYDLGYNFIDSNFKTTDFRKPYEWEE